MDMQRRSFMKMVGLTAGASISRLGSLPLLAQSNAVDYKALVAIALQGGNDGNSMLLPMSTATFAPYAATRGVVALPQKSLIQIGAAAGEFGIHPALSPLASVYGRGRMAFAANVGNLIEPITRQKLLAGSSTVPNELYTHDGQRNEFYAGSGSASANLGWGGSIADIVSSQNQRLPPLISLAGASVFTTGATASSSLILSGYNAPGYIGFDNSPASQARYLAYQAIAASPTTSQLASVVNAVSTASTTQSGILQQALADAGTITTVFPSTDLGRQLQMVAQIIKSRGELGATRQVFFCQMGGFDMHTLLLSSCNSSLGDLAAALLAFDNSMLEIGTSRAVTAFTMSEFSRTLQPNSRLGVDHGWGSNHIVMGGSVKGGDIYGTYPSLEIGGEDDATQLGQWIPTTATVQYGATLARWFGLGDQSLNTVFPLLKAFPGGLMPLLG